MIERHYRLYGITNLLSFPCICYGTKGYFFKIQWAKKYKRFKLYKGHTTADDVAYNFTVNNGKTIYFGLNDRFSTFKIDVYDWLNAHHFDYRGLIEKDLAIPVTKENNPYA